MTNITPSIEPSAAESIEQTTALIVEQGKKPPQSAWRIMLPSMTPWLAVGLFLVIAIALFGILGPLLVQDPTIIRNTGLQAPSSAHILGTTQTGQDVFAQLAYATRGSLEIGLIIGGFADESFSLISNVFLVIPSLPLVIVIAGFVPQAQRGLWTIAVVLALTGWAASSRVLRAQTLSIRNRDYVAASRVAGEKPGRVISVEILPNLLPVLASQFVFAVIFAILSEAGLSFLGLGASNSSTLGTMLFFAQNGFALPLGAWWWFGPPGLIIAMFGMGLSLINFSIDEIINPKLKSARLHRKRAKLARRSA